MNRERTKKGTGARYSHYNDYNSCNHWELRKIDGHDAVIFKGRNTMAQVVPGNGSTTPPPAKGNRSVYADAAALKEYAEGIVNKTVNGSVSPQLYGHAVSYLYDADDGANRDRDSGNRAILKDGSWAKLVREAIATFTNYPKNTDGKYLQPLVIEKERETGAIIGAAASVKTASMSVFLGVKDLMAAGFPEEHALAIYLPRVKATIATMAPKLAITSDAIFEWYREVNPESTIAGFPAEPEPEPEPEPTTV